jgi:hypothetical protein
LNAGLLPAGSYAVAELAAGPGIPGVLALKGPDDDDESAGGVSVAVAPPQVAHRARTQPDTYRSRANRVSVRRASGDRVVGVVELASAGNKASQADSDRFVGKVVGFIGRGVNVLLADYHPPTRRDPHGLHPAVWGELADDPYRPPAGKPLTLAAYSAGVPVEGFVEPLAVGDVQPDMPRFLTPDRYVPVPLEAVFQDAWAAYPRRMKQLVEGPAGG